MKATGSARFGPQGPLALGPIRSASALLACLRALHLAGTMLQVGFGPENR